MPERTAILHVGSISSWTPPGCEAIARLVERLPPGGALISVDPNIRPMLADGPVGAVAGQHPAAVRERLDRLVAQADIVKVSAEDLAWLEPGTGSDGRRSTRPRSVGRPRAGAGAAHRRRRAAADRPPRPRRCCTGGRPRVDRRRHRRRR